MSCLPIATQAEAETGTVNDKAMTPLRTRQAIDALGVSQVVLASSSGGAMVGFEQAADGSVFRTVEEKLRGTVNLRDFGADPTGTSSSSHAFNAALAAAKRIVGTPGDIYLIGSPVSVPAGREIFGNGAILKIGSGVTGLILTGDKSRVHGWTIDGNGGLYAVHNTAHFNEFSENVLKGNIGHFFLSTLANNVAAHRNIVEGLTASTEITTALVAEGCNQVSFTGNQFRDIPVGWAMQVRKKETLEGDVGTRNAVISGNNCKQTMYADEITATSGQTVFNFNLGTNCHIKRIQLNGVPLSETGGNYTVTGTGPSYAVTFAAGRTAGDSVKLVGYRGAENIQVNIDCRDVSITGNVIDGTGDSGILILSPHCTVGNNIVKNCAFAGIAVYGGTNGVAVTGNEISDCAQLDDGLSSPDFPQYASVFAGGILISSEDVACTGNVIQNTAGTMRYGIRINMANMALRTDGQAAIDISANIISGSYADGKIFAPNDTTGQRINSVKVAGPLVRYPAQIDFDQAWTNAPANTAYFDFSGFGGTWSIRDTSVKQGGTASLKTVANEYVDCALLAAGMLRNCVVEISFWAKADSGSSYVTVFTALGGLNAPLTAAITATDWRQYTISFPFTANLDDAILLRFGGTTGFANIQHVQISGYRL